MLRIANYYESRLGRNDGNPLYVTAALKRIQYHSEIAAGKPANPELLKWFVEPDPMAEAIAKEIVAQHGQSIEVEHLYPTGECGVFGQWDLNIHVDWGEDGLTGILPYAPIETPKPFAYWASDTHINNGQPGDSYPYRLSVAKRADYVFCAQKAGLERMKADGVTNAIWLPHAVEPQAYPRQDFATKKYDVCFMGNVNSSNRLEALDRLFREFPNFHYGKGLFNEIAEKLGQSKVCFNISMTDDINMRTFEIMSTGSFCLTNWIPTIEDLFEDGKHLVLYRSLDEMIDKARYYIDHDEEREKIAQAGYEEVRAKHTILHRVKTMLDHSLFAKVPLAV
jgi:hypothetical protein